MRRLAFIGFLIAALIGPSLAVSAAAIPTPPIPATSFSMRILADRLSADRNESIGYTIWLNVSGGTLQLVRVNLTLDPDLDLQNMTMAAPADCTGSRSNLSFAEWQCSFLRAGRSYVWSVSASVEANATRGRSRAATAQAIELGAGPAVPHMAETSVWVLLAVLRLKITADPSSGAKPGSSVQFVVNVTNVGQGNISDEANLTAHNITITIGVSPLLEVGNTPRVINRSALRPSEGIFVAIDGIVRENATAGGAVWVNATLIYLDFAGRPIGPEFEAQVVSVGAPAPLGSDPSSVLAVVAFAVLGIFGAAVVIPAVGERRIAIDEVFLMHRSGILIQHVNRGPDLRKDDDLVASMFVAIQEFVRDSFATKATLDELAFGGRKAAVLRGEHLVLAALVSRGSPRYLFPQMKAVERSLEKAHGEALANWDGRLARLDRAGSILREFLDGGYRRFRGRWR